MIRQAFVLAAGLGKRLRPLTDELPKPLIPIYHKPLITFPLDHLIAFGVESFVINTHRLPQTFADAFPDGRYRGMPLRFIHEPEILGTAGGIRNAESELHEEPFIVYSGDIFTDFDLGRLEHGHLRSGNDVTLALRQTAFTPTVALQNGRVVDIGGKFGCPGEWDFANVSIWSPGMIGRIPPGQAQSFVPILLQAIAAGARVGGVILNEGKWFNVGSPAQYLELHRLIAAEHWKPAYVNDPAWPQPVHPGADVHPTAQLSGCACVARDCRTRAEAVLDDTILWPGSQIASQSELRGCIVRARQTATGILRDAII